MSTAANVNRMNGRLDMFSMTSGPHATCNTRPMHGQTLSFGPIRTLCCVLVCFVSVNCHLTNQTLSPSIEIKSHNTVQRMSTKRIDAASDNGNNEYTGIQIVNEAVRPDSGVGLMHFWQNKSPWYNKLVQQHSGLRSHSISTDVTKLKPTELTFSLVNQQNHAPSIKRPSSRRSVGELPSSDQHLQPSTNQHISTLILDLKTNNKDNPFATQMLNSKNQHKQQEQLVSFYLFEGFVSIQNHKKAKFA